MSLSIHVTRLSWFWLTTAASIAHPSSTLCFRAKHEPNIVPPQKLLGIVEMQASKLLEMGKDRQGKLWVLSHIVLPDLNHIQISC